MTTPKPAYHTILKINMAFLSAAACAAISWAVWPDTLEWWGFGLMSIIFGIAAPSQLIRALVLMVKLYKRDKAIAAFEAANASTDPSKLADEAAMRDAGMIK